MNLIFYVNRILFYILTYSVSSLKYRMHSFISGTEFSQLYSYSIEKTPLKCCRFNSCNIPFTSRIPVPQITSCCSFYPYCFAAMSLKWREMRRPSSFFRQSSWFRPSRRQWPTSAQEPISLLRPAIACNRLSGFQ